MNDQNNFLQFYLSTKPGEMVHSNDDDFEALNAQLIAKNTQLKVALEAIRKKYESYDGEVKTLLRKVLQLLEEKKRDLKI